MHFNAIGRVPGDPILGLMEAYASDTNPRKFDLGVGVYKDAQGLTPILQSVKLAEQRLVSAPVVWSGTTQLSQFANPFMHRPPSRSATIHMSAATTASTLKRCWRP